MFSFTKINTIVFLLNIITKSIRYLTIISISLACLNILLAVNNFFANNFWFGVLNSLFALSGLIFLAQMHQRNKVHRFPSNQQKGISLGGMEK